jgi:hypothetical protein
MARDTRPHVTLISHSPVIYWWPGIVAAYAIAALTFAHGTPLPDDPNGSYVYPSNNPGLIFIAVVMLLIVFTNAKLRGVYSLLTIATIAFIVVLFAWLGWWDAIWDFIPQLSAKANGGFYFLFGTLLLIAWLLAFFVFDRMTYWSVYPGQIVEERLIGGASNSHDTDRLVLEKMDRDLFKHGVLGLGAGDMKMSAPGKEPIYIPNVLFAESKIRKAQDLIAIKPDQNPVDPLVMPESV